LVLGFSFCWFLALFVIISAAGSNSYPPPLPWEHVTKPNLPFKIEKETLMTLLIAVNAQVFLLVRTVVNHFFPSKKT
jgi:hypothetical protein